MATVGRPMLDEEGREYIPYNQGGDQMMPLGRLYTNREPGREYPTGWRPDGLREGGVPGGTSGLMLPPEDDVSGRIAEMEALGLSGDAPARAPLPARSVLVREPAAPTGPTLDERYAPKPQAPRPAAKKPAAPPRPTQQSEDRIRSLLSPSERAIYDRQMKENATISDGPARGTRMEGRRLPTDEVPLEELTPEQRRDSSSFPGSEAPRAARGGMFVNDPLAGGERGAPVPRAPDYNVLAEAKTLRERAAAFGIDITKYDPRNAADEAALRVDVARAQKRHDRMTGGGMGGQHSQNGMYYVDPEGVEGGGYRYRPNARNNQMMDAKSREMTLNSQWDMYSREARQAGLTYEDFAKRYDEGGAAGLRSLTQVLRSNQRDDRRDNVRQRAENANMAQLMGTTPGHVAAYNELQNAAASGDDRRMVAALFGLHAINPHVGLGNAGVMYGQQATDREAAARVAGAAGDKKETPIEKAARDLAAANAMPFTPARVSSYGMHYASSLPNGTPVDPLERNRHIVTHGAAGAREVAMKPNRTPEEEAGLRAWTDAHRQSGVSGTVYRQYLDWASRLGLDPLDEKVKALYAQMTGTPPNRNLAERAGDAWNQMWSGQAPNQAQAQPGGPVGHPGH